MKLYTKTGDDGSTGLIGGQRVPKDDPRVAAYGDVDETNAAIGLAAVACAGGPIAEQLRVIQETLFTVGAELANPDSNVRTPAIGTAHIDQIEHWIDEACDLVAPLRNFVLPGGSEAAARLHHARTVCRRAERLTVSLAARQPVDHLVIVYLNRLSDLLFALARLANQLAGVDDIPWKP